MIYRLVELQNKQDEGNELDVIVISEKDPSTETEERKKQKITTKCYEKAKETVKETK